MKISAVIMASGFSKRAGCNKLLYRIGGKTVVEHVLDTVSRCGFNSYVVVTQYEEVKEAAKERNMRVVDNTMAESGQSMSIKLGVLNSPCADAYAFFAADQPFICENTITMGCGKIKENNDSIVVMKYEDSICLPVFFPVLYRERLLELTGDKGARDIIKRHPEKVLFIDIGDSMETFDIDNEHDYETAVDYAENQKGKNR